MSINDPNLDTHKVVVFKSKEIRQNLSKGRTDWERVKSLSDKEIEKAARDDSDNPIWTHDMIDSARLITPVR